MVAASRSILAVALALATSCAQTSGEPCSAAVPCGDGDRCVVGACRPGREPIAPEKSRRVVLLARDVAVLSSSERVATDAAVTPFGARGAGEVIVLLSFDGALGRSVDVASAFVVLDPEAASPGPTAPITIDAAEILGPWAEADPSWGRAPRVGPSIGTASIPAARRAPLRVDVTRSVARARGTGFGIALRASGDDPIGARLMTGAGGSSGPRLELYLK